MTKQCYYRFADNIANGLFSESFGLPEMCWRTPVHLDISILLFCVKRFIV